MRDDRHGALTRRRGVVVSAVALSIAFGLLGPGAVAATPQVNAESFAKLGFNFSPPGARSAALGGAFIGVADDATAAESNPAGLTLLLNPQVSAEFKGIEYARFLGREAGGGTDGREFTDQVGFPSFASVVVPVAGVHAALFRHELVNYQNTVWSIGAERARLLPYTSVLDLLVTNWGGALAARLGPVLRFGVAGGLSQMNTEVDFVRYRLMRFEPNFVQNRLTVRESGTGAFWNAGVLWTPTPGFSAGAVFKKRARFSGLEYTLERTSDPTEQERVRVGDLKIPDALGVGASVRLLELLTLSVDVVRTRYSQLSEEQVIVYDTTLSPHDYTAQDGNDYHVGLEYIQFLGQTPISVRGGLALVAASNIYFVGSHPVEEDLWGTEPEDRTRQLTIGVGGVLWRRIQLEVAGVLSEPRREFILSGVYFLSERR